MDDDDGDDDAEYVTLSTFFKSPKGWFVVGVFGGMLIWSMYFKDKRRIRDRRDSEPLCLPEGELISSLKLNMEEKMVLEIFQERRRDENGRVGMLENGMLINRVSGHTVHGINNIERFYVGFNTAFKNREWNMLRIVVSEQSVWVEYEFKALHVEVWENVFNPSNRRINLRISMYLKYDEKDKHFSEEIWYLDSPNPIINATKGIEFEYEKSPFKN